MARSTVATVNGHAIRKVQSRFGKLYQVGTTGTAFSAFEAAKTFASKMHCPALKNSRRIDSEQQRQ